MFKRILALVICLVMVAGMIPAVSAYDREFQGESAKSVDQCCHTVRVDTMDLNYVRPAYDGYLIEITPQRVEDTFNYLDEHYVKNHPEQALMVYTGTAKDKEVLKTLAETITAGCTTDKEKADAIDAWLQRNIYYDIGTSAYASDTFYRREGNCLSYANLMQFLLRSLGIPAVIGDGWRGDMKTSTVDLFNMEGHAWCFVLLDGEWVLYDPLWIEGGTTDRDYMAEWIYFDTVETICPASDGDNLPPEAYDKPKPYYTDGKFYTWSEFLGNTMGNLTLFLNNQAYAYIANQCEGDIEDGMCYLDGRDKSGMVRGELYRNGWASYGDYNENAAMHVSYYFPNGMTADGYVATLDGKDRFMYTNTSNEILAPEYDIIDGLFTLQPGYSGPFLALSWQDGVMDSHHEYITTWESLNPEIVSVDQSGNITCHQEGYADIQVTMQRVENNGNLTHLAGRRLSVLVSSEERIADYSDREPCEHSYEFNGTVDATCEDWGYEIHICTLCGERAEVYTQEPLGHAYVSGLCTRCGAEDSDWEAAASGTCGDSLTWELSGDGTLTISGTGDMYDYDENPWKAYQNDVTSVVIAEGTTSIGEKAFYHCYNLANVTIPDSVTSIGDRAFECCYALNEITIPDSVTSIGEAAFMSCFGLASVTIPDSVESIGALAFYGCTAPYEMEMPLSANAVSTHEVVYDGGLLEVYIGSGVTYIGPEAFANCKELKGIYVDAANTAYSNDDLGVLFDKQKTTLIQAPGALSGNYTIPGSVTSIGDWALSICPGLTGVTVPAGVVEIGSYAFSAHGTLYFDFQTGLEEIVFCGDAPEMGAEVFWDIAATVYYPDNNATWTADVMQNYGGTITWMPYEAETYTVDWKSVNTSLTGSIDLNFYVVLSDNLVNDDTFVRFTCNGKTLDVPFAEAIPSVKDGVTRYRFSYKVFAKEMTDTVSAQVMTKNGPVGEAMPYSVAKYCYGMIGYSKNEEMVALCKAMLNYGTAAQNYFGYKLDNLANASLSEADRTVEDFDAAAFAHSVVGSEEGIKASGAKLLLEADVAIQVSFQITGTKPVTDYTFTIDGAEADYTEASGSKYYFELDGIAASTFGDPHAFSVGGLTLNYSVLSYANQVYKSSTIPEARGLVNAMYAYYMATDAYVN